MARRRAPILWTVIPVLGLVALAVSTYPVSAQNEGSQPPPGGPGRANRGMMPGLDLTPRQQTKVGQIVTNAQNQLKKILTPEQLKQWEAMQPRPGGFGGPGGPRGGFGMLPESLNLTDDQKAKVQTIMQEQMQKFQALGSDTSLSQQDRMAKMQELGQAMQEKIKAVLTPEQQKQWADLQRNMGGPGGPGGRGGFGGPGGQRGFNILPDSLNPTDEQKAKAQQIMQEQMQQFQALGNDTSLSQEARMAKMREMGQAMQTRIRAILTPEQQKQWDQMQTRFGGPGGPGGRGGFGGPGGQRGSNILPDSLNPTDEQKAKAQQIMQEQMQQFQALGNDTSLSQEDRMAKMREMGQAMQARIRAILTPEQQKQWDEMQPGRGGFGGPGMGGRPGSMLDALNLTDEQMTKVKAIRKSASAEFRKILTPEQQRSMARFQGWEQRFPF